MYFFDIYLLFFVIRRGIELRVVSGKGIFTGDTCNDICYDNSSQFITGVLGEVRRKSVRDFHFDFSTCFFTGICM